MTEIHEIKITHMDTMPSNVQDEIVKKVTAQSETFKKNFRGFIKIVYVTSSPKRVESIEPIDGTIQDYFEKNKKDGVVMPTF